MTTPEDVGIFVEHVKDMRRMINNLPKESVENALYGYVEACRFMYGKDSLITQWIECEYLHQIED